MPAAPRSVGLLLFDHVDLLDVGGPYEVFLTAARLVVRDGRPPPFAVSTIGATRDPVTAYGGLRLVPDRSATDVEGLDVLVVPGAVDITRVRAVSAVTAALADVIGRSSVVTSVCTGAFLLAAHGLLDEGPWTTHWEDVGLLAAEVSSPPADGTPPWVDTGLVVTAGGLSSGIAMGLHLVDRFVGRDLAVRTARQIDYDWDPDAGVVATRRG
jgi:transcriptional regulator GlxA family with amidase domain